MNGIFSFKKVFILFVFTTYLLFQSACIIKKEKTISGSTRGAPPIVSSVTLSNDTLTITGTLMSGVKNISIGSSASKIKLEITSVSATQVLAKAEIMNVSFQEGTTYDMELVGTFPTQTVAVYVPEFYTKDEIDAKIAAVKTAKELTSSGYKITSLTLDDYNQKITISGTSTGSASCYQILYSSSSTGMGSYSSFTKDICGVALTDRYIINGITEGDYYIRVRPVDSTGKVGNMSNAVLVSYKPIFSDLTFFGEYGTGSGQFDDPVRMTFDSAGNAYVAGCNADKIYKFNESNFSGTFQVLVDTGLLDCPVGLFFDGTLLWVNEYLSYKAGSLNPSNPVATYQTYADGSTDRGWDIYRDSSGYVWVADTLADRVNKFDPSDVENTFKVYSGNATTDYPNGLLMDSDNNMWIVMRDRAAIVRLNTTTSETLTFGQNQNSELPMYFTNPFGITKDSLGLFYVADASLKTITRFSPSDPNGTSITYSIPASLIDGIYGVAYYGSYIWFVDRNNDQLGRLKINSETRTFTP